MQPDPCALNPPRWPRYCCTEFLLFTIIPAAFIGAAPAEFVRAFSWRGLAQLLGAALVLLGLAIAIFHRGLRRYESGSVIQVQS